MLKTLDVDELVGMDIQPAKDLIYKQGWRFKVIREDGIDLIKDPIGEARTDRILLSVASKVVINAIVG